jgi:asparagine synthase (glutamine-hydrolysing)
MAHMARSSTTPTCGATHHVQLLAGVPRLDGVALDAQSLTSVWTDGSPQSLLSRLEGDFSLVVDGPHGERLAAVDRFAIRPLCWRVVDGQLCVSARADELAAIPPRAALDSQAIFDYLYFHVIPAPRTAFEGVKRLPPGHFVHFKDGREVIEPYWTPRFEEPANPMFDELGARFREAVARAVGELVDRAHPACFLSGGTDSSTVAGMVAQVTGGAPATYSIGFDAEGYDEMEYARIAARRFGCRHHEYYVTPADLLEGIPKVAAHYDQPFGNSSAVPAYFCAQRAREDGVTRLLAGDGGDELFGGNARYAKQSLFELYGRLPAPLRRGLLEPLLLQSPVGRLPLFRKGASYVEQARVPIPDRFEQYNLLRRVGMETILHPDFLAQVRAQGPAEHQRAVWAGLPAASTLNRMLAFDWRYTLADNDLPKVTGSAALAGVEVAFPFLHRAVLEVSLALPTHYKLKGQQLRWFFKQSLRGWLPEEIITKKKHGFGLPFGVWATRDGALARFAQESLDSLSERRIVQPGFTRRLMSELLPAHPGYYGELVWILMMLEQWLQRQGRP